MKIRNVLDLFRPSLPSSVQRHIFLYASRLFVYFIMQSLTFPFFSFAFPILHIWILTEYCYAFGNQPRFWSLFFTKKLHQLLDVQMLIQVLSPFSKYLCWEVISFSTFIKPSNFLPIFSGSLTVCCYVFSFRLNLSFQLMSFYKKFYDNFYHCTFVAIEKASVHSKH